MVLLQARVNKIYNILRKDYLIKFAKNTRDFSRERFRDTYSGVGHNALFRGKDLTDYFNSGQMSKAIADGTFKNILW